MIQSLYKLNTCCPHLSLLSLHGLSVTDFLFCFAAVGGGGSGGGGALGFGLSEFEFCVVKCHLDTWSVFH